MILPSYQLSVSAPILEYNMTNHLNFLSNNFQENIGLEARNNKKEEIRSVDTTSNVSENSKLANIDKQRLTILN